MSNTVDIGIDLGTTNSSVAIMQNGRPTVLSNADGQSTLPSCVAVNERGEIFVGERKAVTDLLADPVNGAEGFKRQMGTGMTWTFPANGHTYSAVNLSAILLGELRRLAAEHLNEEPGAAVVTVPANFGDPQKKAVIRASEEAGFSQVTLLQEPVAAGLAYGWDKSGMEKPFLVYDLGGGTFDVALMQCVSGQLVVQAHLGAEACGGRDLDYAFCTQLILPRLAGRADSKDVNQKQLLLLHLCEEAKIRLSKASSATVALEGRIKSMAGKPMEDVFTITREEYEPLALPLIDRTIMLVRQLLEEKGLKPKDLAEVVLVGGPTKTPRLRSLLQEQLRVKLSTQLDAMTVVAQGAAFFAASIVKPKVKSHSIPQAGTIAVRLEYDPVAAQSKAPVGLAADAKQLPEGSQVRFRRTDGQWASGLIAIQKGRAAGQVALLDGQESVFKVEVFGPSGLAISVEPDEFSILQGLVAPSPPLSRSIGVIVEKEGGEQLDFQVIAKRGQPTPLIAVTKFKTTRLLNVGDPSSALTVHFREGESKLPLRNREIGRVHICGTDIDRPLPENSPVEITLRVDPSCAVIAKVFILSLNKTWTNKLEINSEELPPKPEDLQIRLEIEQQRLQDLSAAGVSTAHLQAGNSEIEREIAAARAGNRDSLARAIDQLSNLELSVDRVEEQEGPRLALQNLDATEKGVEDLITRYGDSDHKRRLMLLKGEAQRARSTGDSTLARSASEGLMRLGAEVYWAQTGAWVDRFQTLVTEGGFSDPVLASRLTIDGRRALESGDLPLLQQVVRELQLIAPLKGTDSLLRQFGGLARTQ